jgi:lambda repressor-like predicted transcriptional regulator
VSASYAKLYAIDRAMGRERKTPISQVLDHYEGLEAQGFNLTGIARAAGLQPVTVHHAIRAQKGPMKKVGEAILRVTPEAILASAGDRELVPATGTARRIRGLKRLGWNSPAIAEATGLSCSAIEHAGDLERARVSSRVRKAVKAFYEANKHVQGPSARTAKWSAKRHYSKPLAWDDETIEDPRVKPQRVVGLWTERDERADRAEASLKRWLERRSA